MDRLLKSTWKINIFTSAAFLIFILCCVKVFSSPVVNGSINTTNRYAYGENVGWIDFGADNSNIHITDSSLTGYAYGENVGWISLNCSNADSCATVDYGVLNDGTGDLTGYAWSENLGWVDFSAVNINSEGEFTGYAYGENVGWISFNCSNTDTCDTVDYKVATDYTPQDQRPACNNGRDDDGDGLTDYPDDEGCSSLDDNNEVDSFSHPSFIPPSKPNLSNITITTNSNGNIDITNLPSNISHIAVSTTPSFNDSSWEPIENTSTILSNYTDTTIYIKLRTNQGASSDVITYDTDNNTIISDNQYLNLQEGDIVKTSSSFDVYIIKYNNNKQYKRLILSPHVFNSYQHLKWNNIKTISQEQLNQYQTSNLVKVKDDNNIYYLTPNNDTGTKQIVATYNNGILEYAGDNTEDDIDIDSVYEINEADRDNYVM